jgi:hypothetical protein
MPEHILSEGQEKVLLQRLCTGRGKKEISKKVTATEG